MMECEAFSPKINRWVMKEQDLPKDFKMGFAMDYIGLQMKI